MLRIAVILLALAAVSQGCAPGPVRTGAGSVPLDWDGDSRWEAFDRTFHRARELGCAGVDESLESLLVRIEELSASITTGIEPDDPLMYDLEEAFIDASALAAACPRRLPSLLSAHVVAARAASSSARKWDRTDRTARDRIYRHMYTLRATRDQAVLMAEGVDPDSLALPRVRTASGVPTGTWLGIPVRSGDLLVTRGVVASSALTSRGSDRPGVFSHVAMLHIDPETGALSFVESFPETGGEAHSPEFFLADTKRRILVLRLREEHPALRREPTLPHRAAEAALRSVTERRVRFDFSLDAGDRRRQFCSEIPLFAYGDLGVRLWEAPSTISAPGTVHWLFGMGARSFTTQVPSDLEFDPNLEFAGEWFRPDGLWPDLLDNVASDALFEAADHGLELRSKPWLVPAVWGLKAWSWTLNRLGRKGPLPEGAGALQALRFREFSVRHAALVVAVRRAADRYVEEHGHRPYYPELLAMARRALARTS